MPYKKQTIGQIIHKYGLFLLALAIILLVNLPTLTVIISLFKTNAEFESSNALFPAQPTLSGYVNVFRHSNFPHYLLNSFIVASIVAFSMIIISSMAGYVLSCWGKHSLLNIYSYFLLALQMILLTLVLIPLFYIAGEKNCLLVWVNEYGRV